MQDMANITASSHHLHTATVQHVRSTINRAHILFHSILLTFLLYYRLSRLFEATVDQPHEYFPITAWVFVFASELLLSFVWLLTQSFRWRLVSRSVSPERLPEDEKLPTVDVFVCTVDPRKEPTLEVMNTVISAMSLDYPPEKLAVYLSDDGGASVTLNGLREAAAFARWWVPFCRRHGIKTRCPEAYFSSAFADDDRNILGGNDLKEEEEHIKESYEQFKKRVATGGDAAAAVEDVNRITGSGRAPVIQVIHDGKENENSSGGVKLPLLVYVSREKRPSYPHRFKAGALNTLLRVSGIITNSDYILVLDCDMYCNDPTSARQAMCYHFDPNMSPSLAFVQYPQVFYNVSKNDIYDSQARSAYKTKWQGMDGLRGPVLSGTGFYLKRMALYTTPNHKKDSLLFQSNARFGPSHNFIASLHGDNEIIERCELSKEVIEEAHFLATCAFEEGTKWGSELGFSYESLLESTFTGYLLHCKGWTSVYSFPNRPCFLGCTTIDMKDAMVQLRKWSAGLFQVGISKFSPLTYAISRMSILQSMCYGYFTFQPLLSLALLIYAIVPQLCFYKAIPLYPKVSDPRLGIFCMVWASSLLQHLYEVISCGSSVGTWWNEQRIWIVKSVTGSLFGCLDVLMKWIGMRRSVFRLTNKVIDREKLEKYERGKFDFEGAELFMVPLISLVVWNLGCFIGGVRGMLIQGNFTDMFPHFFLSSFILVLSYPIIEGMVTQKGKTRM